MGHHDYNLLDRRDVKSAPAVTYSASPGLERFLAEQNITLAATSYQSGRLYMLGRHPKGGLMLSEEYFRTAMGLHVQGRDLYLLSDNSLFHLKACPEGPDQIQTYGIFKTHFIGDVNGHDLALTQDGKPIFVCTRFNCLATVDEAEGFQPLWAPSFLQGPQKGDRCHLNGLAIEQGASAYVTGLARSCKVDGWRRNRIDQGFVMDVRSQRLVCEGLSMPHSPRVHDHELWVCNSGAGELGTVDLETKRFHPHVFCAGFIRGLAFHGRYAFVGLSRPRHTRYSGLPVLNQLRDLNQTAWTGIQIIDTLTLETVGWFRIDGAISELYDVAVVPDTACAVVNSVAAT